MLSIKKKAEVVSRVLRRHPEIAIAPALALVVVLTPLGPDKLPEPYSLRGVVDLLLWCAAVVFLSYVIHGAFWFLVFLPSSVIGIVRDMIDSIGDKVDAVRDGWAKRRDR